MRLADLAHFSPRELPSLGTGLGVATVVYATISEAEWHKAGTIAGVGIIVVGHLLKVALDVTRLGASLRGYNQKQDKRMDRIEKHLGLGPIGDEP